ncbi:hypothetical protein K435DRAFT_589243, partial [Dendrothele bispora CBS 962.96]
ISSSSMGYLISASPLTSANPPPSYHSSTISPLKRKYNTLLELKPATETESLLQDALRSSQNVLLHYKEVALSAQAYAVLANSYVGRASTQLQEAEERRKKPKKKGHLNGDGMPKLLSGDDFFEKVLEHDKMREAATKEKESRADVKKVYDERMEAYKKETAGIKEKNEKVKATHGKKLNEWKKKRDDAK